MKKGRSEDSGHDIDEAESSLSVPMWMVAERPSVSRNELKSVAVVFIDLNATSRANRVRAAGQGDNGIARDESAPVEILSLQQGVRHLTRSDDGATKASTTAVATNSMSAILMSVFAFIQ
ncbi:hypothetical protein ACHAW5_001302 [Stephanodiscus triporus]|uniref:Uncharacterized protein n=1 Tax=Stephanodiscus triporus TaxID=2934178 RepID=A0ABD3NG64_9STRA